MAVASAQGDNVSGKFMNTVILCTFPTRIITILALWLIKFNDFSCEGYDKQEWF